MAVNPDPQLGINSWLEEELREQYHHDRSSVDDDWKHLFDDGAAGNGAGSAAEIAPRNGAPARVAPPPYQAESGEELSPLRGAAARIAENMAASVQIPLATSQRTMPVKVIDENRRLINNHRTLLRQSKISYTHLIGWAIVRAVKANPSLNTAFAESNGAPYRVLHKAINLGIAVDVAGKSGSRNLVVPNIKNAGGIEFSQYVELFDDLVARARAGKLTPADFQGTTISITNPGTVGTLASIPRLMPGQGAIIAVGAMDFPPEYHGVAPEVRAALGISKVMTVTCTYDHRIIQGAESGMFIGKLQALLDGEEGFYEEVFASLKIPYSPVKWEPDRKVSSPVAAPYASELGKEAAVVQLINAYRVRGHLIANLDPLVNEPSYHPELDPLTYGLTIWDLDREFLTGTLNHANEYGQHIAKLRDVLEQLRQTYCGPIGCEYMNIQHPEQKRWLQQRMEPEANNWPIDKETRLRILQKLLDAEGLEHFLGTRFVGQKRFGLDGAETAIPILDGILNIAADHNVSEIVIGMAHRGRLNVLANIVGKPLEQIFAEFEGNIDPGSTQGSGDVKYHLGASGVRTSASGREIKISVSPNPSHLEAVDPVVEGIVRPKQDQIGDVKRERVIPVLVHGDAAFAGQGVVAETLNLSQLDGYWTGGTIHLIVNNQIGFTTLPDEGRSTPYSTDVARMVQAPIFHVNGDDPDAAMRVVQMAFDYRQEFKKDVVIDMFCYRRYGHNEADDPAYTQPILYRKIKEHPSVTVIFGERLVRDGVLSAAEVEQMRKHAIDRYAQAFDSAQKSPQKFEPYHLGSISLEQTAASSSRAVLDISKLQRTVEALTTFPEGFTYHPKLKGFIEKRKQAFAAGGPIDWAFAEALAFGTLALGGTPVRLSGQDSGRGTFSQRHLVFYDYENGQRYMPLKHLAPDQANFDVFDSSLSEYAVVGFEFGYSVADPQTLTMWEAQFGDFANGAQIVIDQFITTAESKWGQPSGLVMLLPHGFEGQGPEHSSARIERFLSLCAEDNLQVINCTTPAQYFHVLRRQRRKRKPLIIFTPKGILRDPRAVSTFDELLDDRFHEVLDDSTADPAQVKRLIFSAGKIYYDLLAAREKAGAHHVALARLEQIYPFAHDQVDAILKRYPAAELVWVQEEPRNMGAWRFIYGRFHRLLEGSGRALRYIGRPLSSSPASGSAKRHAQEQSEIVTAALVS